MSNFCLWCIINSEILFEWDTLKEYFRIQKILHLLRCSPCHNHQTNIRNLLRATIWHIANVGLFGSQGMQASLPSKSGSLGIRCGVSLALPAAFLSSESIIASLQNLILLRTVGYSDSRNLLYTFHAFHFITVPFRYLLRQANELSGTNL